MRSSVHASYNLSPAPSRAAISPAPGPAGFDHKSTALLLRPSPPHYAIVGTGDVSIWESDDLLTWRAPTRLLSGRQGAFDSGYVEAGAPPVPLSDGNYLATYDTILK